MSPGRSALFHFITHFPGVNGAVIPPFADTSASFRGTMRFFFPPLISQWKFSRADFYPMLFFSPAWQRMSRLLFKDTLSLAFQIKTQVLPQTHKSLVKLAVGSSEAGKKVFSLLNQEMIEWTTSFVTAVKC